MRIPTREDRMLLLSTANSPKVIVTRNEGAKRQSFSTGRLSAKSRWHHLSSISNTFAPRLSFRHPCDFVARLYRVGQMSSGSRPNSAAIRASRPGHGLFSAFPAAVAWYPWARDRPARVLPRFFKAANTSAGCQSSFFGFGRMFMWEKFSLENRV